MREFYDFILEGINLKNKIILDAAVGAGESTYFWAKKIHEEGGTSKIIAIDNDLPEIWIKRINERLGKYKKYVELKEADIFDLSFLREESIDIINCDDTIVFLNPKPLKLLFAFKEFSKVLKENGILIITSEIPVEDEKEEQWKRWNLAKAIYDLKGETWSVEPYPEEVKFALELFGFRVYEEKLFPARKNAKYEDCMEEWREIMLKDIEELKWGSDLKDSLIRTVDELYSKVKKDGYLMNPPRYILKSIKE